LQSDADGPVHLVGHSTGGLDARLLMTPGASLATDLPVEEGVRSVKTVVTVSTPHHGTPLATFFSTLYGKRLLQILSLVTVYVLRFGTLPLSVLIKLGALFVRLDDRVGLRDTVADQIYSQLLGDFSPERRQELREFLERTGKDQGLMGQLTPEGIDLLNASATDRPGVRYGSVINTVERPQVRTAITLGLDPYAQVSHGLFHALHRLTSRPGTSRLPRPKGDTAKALVKILGGPPAAADNDGIVPVLSQVRGDIVHVARADHLDVIGHFGDKAHNPPHYDWFASGSRFNRACFEHLWSDVARYIAGQQIIPGVSAPGQVS
jgi:hypothetical protein